MTIAISIMQMIKILVMSTQKAPSKFNDEDDANIHIEVDDIGEKSM